MARKPEPRAHEPRSGEWRSGEGGDHLLVRRRRDFVSQSSRTRTIPIHSISPHLKHTASNQQQRIYRQSTIPHSHRNTITNPLNNTRTPLLPPHPPHLYPATTPALQPTAQRGPSSCYFFVFAPSLPKPNRYPATVTERYDAAIDLSYIVPAQGRVMPSNELRVCA